MRHAPPTVLDAGFRRDAIVRGVAVFHRPNFTGNGFEDGAGGDIHFRTSDYRQA